MDVIPLALPELKLVRPRRHRDERGWLAETYRHDRFAAAGIAETFVQDNQSFSERRGTIRGCHLQRAPHAQAKLVRVLSGRILDVAVDLRQGSPRFGRAGWAELDAEDGAMLYIPEGFAHGFCTLTDAVHVLYKASAVYAPECEFGVLWNDPALGIPWPVTPDEAIVSAKDRALPPLSAVAPVVP